MHPSSLSRLAGRFILVACAAATSLCAQASAAATTASTVDESVTLDRFVVSASRTPQDLAFTPSAVAALSVSTFNSEQTLNLSRALAAAPGVVITSNGALGSQNSVFIRGGSSHHTLFIVDGVRMNDRSASYSNFLGGADILGVDRVEVLRGPQSTLYGSSALGGVIVLNTTHGRSGFHGTLLGEAGSFDTWAGGAEVVGGTEKLGYSASLARITTENDRPQNDFKQWSYTTRVEGKAAESLVIGATLRSQQGDYTEPGSRLFPSLGQVGIDNHLVTAYAEWRGDGVTSRLTAAEHRRVYDFASAYGTSHSRNRREILDWQTAWSAVPALELVGGVNLERSRYDVNTYRTNDQVFAGFLSGTYRLRSDVVVTGGLRYDDFDSFGSATTGRAGVAWLPAKGTKLRATYGTGFSAPGSDDRFGVPEWGQLASPNLRAEKSRGWDFGVDQEIADGRAMVSATYFKNRFRNLFQYDIVDFTTFQGRVVNKAKASSEGVELAATGRLSSTVGARLSYTYLEAKDDITGARATRRPRHVVDADLHVQATNTLLLGAGVHGVASRLEGTVPVEDYTTVRVYASYEAIPGLFLKVRVENALDESYEDVRGYAALPRGVFAGVEWRF